MSRYTAYKIVKASSDTDLEFEINEFLQRGWEPLGGVQIAKLNSQSAYYQAIGKRKPKDEVAHPTPR